MAIDHDTIRESTMAGDDFSTTSPWIEIKRPITISLGAINRVENEHGAEPTAYGSIRLPTRFLAPGHRHHLTRAELAEQLVRAFEESLEKYKAYLVELGGDVTNFPYMLRKEQDATD